MTNHHGDRDRITALREGRREVKAMEVPIDALPKADGLEVAGRDPDFSKCDALYAMVVAREMAAEYEKENEARFAARHPEFLDDEPVESYWGPEVGGEE